MAVLCWRALLIMVLSAGTSSATVDQNQLTRTVEEVLNRYRPSYKVSAAGQLQNRYPMFSLAVTIPYNEATKTYDLSDLDSGEKVRDTILKCDVYTGDRVVAATVLRWPNVLSQCPDARVQWPHFLKKCPAEVETWADVQRLCPGKIREGTADHAEYRTSQNIKALFKTENKEDLLLFYVLSSPCDKRCTRKKSRWSILDSINQIVNWNNYAVVFSNIFQPRDGPKIPESDLCESIRRLGSHQVKGRSIGLNNIFRCHGKPVQCTSCSSNNQVTPYCYSDESQSDSRPNLPSCPPASKNGPRDRDKQSSDIFTSAGLFANVDGKTAGGQRGSGPGLDSGSAGVKGRKRRSKRKKQNNNNKDEAVGSLSQSGQKNSNTNVDSKTAGGQSGRNAE